MPTVLIADDNAEMLETLEQIFTFYQFDVVKANDGKEAVEAAEKQMPDLVVLDGMMPVMDGFEACKSLKGKSKTKDIPVIFLTANYIDVKDRITGFELGADDYILKPFNSKELVTRCNKILQRHNMMRMLRNKNEKLNTKNKKIVDELANLLERSKVNDDSTFIDNVTGLYNFNFFQKRLKEEFLRAKRHENELSIVIVGFRNLEKINEVFGHQIGNYIIMKMANALLNKTRVSDVLARSDNDRFYIILPQTDAQGCYFEAERIRVTLSNVNYFDDDLIETIKYPKRKISDFQNIGINLGAATYPFEGEIVREDSELLNCAEEAFKKSRSTGDDITIAYGVLQS
ncbi:MAG TPA: response regulator [Caldithrix sp.]|nr:response regulator [Calditrichaceae bacterium]HEM49445.1 response regulator [Caldithrix sp.]